MKNNISLLVIYRDNKPSADCALRREKMKTNYNYKNYIYQLHYKGKSGYH